MLTRLAAFGICILCAGAPALAAAQELAAYGSCFNVDGEDDAWGGGLYFGADYLQLAQHQLTIDARAGYVQDVAGRNSADLLPVEAGLSLALYHASPISLFTGAGGGAYIFNSDGVEIDNSAGWYGVIGCRILLNDAAALRAEALYRDTMQSSGATDIKGLVLNAGLSFRFDMAGGD